MLVDSFVYGHISLNNGTYAKYENCEFYGKFSEEAKDKGLLEQVWERHFDH